MTILGSWQDREWSWRMTDEIGNDGIGVYRWTYLYHLRLHGLGSRQSDSGVSLVDVKLGGH